MSISKIEFVAFVNGKYILQVTHTYEDSTTSLPIEGETLKEARDKATDCINKWLDLTKDNLHLYQK